MKFDANALSGWFLNCARIQSGPPDPCIPSLKLPVNLYAFCITLNSPYADLMFSARRYSVSEVWRRIFAKSSAVGGLYELFIRFIYVYSRTEGIIVG